MKKKKYYAEGGKNTDTVPAMLTPGEVVLNSEQQEALGKLVGMKPAALFEKIGIPGFAGGGVADKKDALVQYYKDGGVEDRIKTRKLDPYTEETAWQKPSYISPEPRYREHLMYPMEKGKGLKAALQRFLPGGKSGWVTASQPTRESWESVRSYQRPEGRLRGIDLEMKKQ